MTWTRRARPRSLARQWSRTTQALPVFVFLLLSFVPRSFSFRVPPLHPSFLLPFFLPFFLPLVFLTSIHFELVEQRLDLRHGAIHDGIKPRRRRQLRRRDFPRQHLELRSIKISPFMIPQYEMTYCPRR